MYPRILHDQLHVVEFKARWVFGGVEEEAVRRRWGRGGGGRTKENKPRPPPTEHASRFRAAFSFVLFTKHIAGKMNKRVRLRYI